MAEAVALMLEQQDIAFQSALASSSREQLWMSQFASARRRSSRSSLTTAAALDPAGMCFYPPLSNRKVSIPNSAVSEGCTLSQVKCGLLTGGSVGKEAGRWGGSQLYTHDEAPAVLQFNRCARAALPLLSMHS